MAACFFVSNGTLVRSAAGRRPRTRSRSYGIISPITIAVNFLPGYQCTILLRSEIMVFGSHLQDLQQNVT